MSKRILLQPGKVVISKPGYDADNPSLAENRKIFDSDWFFAGQVVLCKYVSLTYPVDQAGQFDVMYPKALSYAPSGMVYPVSLSGGNLIVKGWETGVTNASAFPNTGEGLGYWQFLNDRARNVFTAISGPARTYGYLVIAIGAA